jgi:rare lipoprotein A
MALRVAFCALALTPVPSFARMECGEASWYDHAGQPSASGGIIDPTALTAAHPSLPFGSKVEVENLDNDRTVILKIDDRGPFTQGRIIDVSRAAAEALDFKGDGVTQVRVTAIETRLKSASAENCR